MGWDMAIGPDGPAIIEGNDFPGTDLCQLAPFCPEKTGLWPYYKELLHLLVNQTQERRCHAAPLCLSKKGCSLPRGAGSACTSCLVHLET